MGVVRRGVAEVLRVCPSKEITYLGTNLLDPLLQIATIYYTKQVIDHAANGRTDETVGYVALFVAVSAVLAVNAKVSRSVSPNLDRYLSHHGTLLLIEKVNSYPHLDLFDSRSLQDDLEVARRGHNLASVGAFVGALITKKLLSYSDAFSDGNFNHGNSDHIFCRLGEDFKVLGQAPKSTQPSKGSFDNPPFGNHLESLRWFRGDVES